MITSTGVFLMYYNPMDMERRRTEAEMELRHKGKRDPGLPPEKRSGILVIVIGLIAGAIVGGFIGGFFGFVALSIGVIVGATLGVIISDRTGRAIKKVREARRESKTEEQGPFR